MVPGMLQILLLAVITGGALYLFSMLPIDATIKKVATVLVLIIAVVWALKYLMGVVH